MEIWNMEYGVWNKEHGKWNMEGANTKSKWKMG